MQCSYALMEYKNDAMQIGGRQKCKDTICTEYAPYAMQIGGRQTRNGMNNKRNVNTTRCKYVEDTIALIRAMEGMPQ